MINLIIDFKLPFLHLILNISTVGTLGGRGNRESSQTINKLL